jgi:hypothetical protein
MASLLDIGPLIRVIEIRGTKLQVRGISALGVVYLLNRFPVLRAAMTGHSMKDMTMEMLVALAPEAIASIIAVGLGYNGTSIEDQEKAEEVTGGFSIDEQIYALTEILEVTLPRGIGPFVEMISKLAVKAEGLGKEAATKLGVPSSGVSRTDTTQPSPGSTHPES